MIFIVIVIYKYYVLLKRKDNACDELLFLNFILKKLTNFFIDFLNLIHGYMYKPADTSKSVDHSLNGYPREYGLDTDFIFNQRSGYEYQSIRIHGYPLTSLFKNIPL